MQFTAKSPPLVSTRSSLCCAGTNALGDVDDELDRRRLGSWKSALPQGLCFRLSHWP